MSRPEPALAEKLALIEASGIAVLRLQDPRTGAAGQAPTQALPRAIGLRRPQAGLNRAGRTRSARIGQLAETYHASQRNPSQRDPKSAQPQVSATPVSVTGVSAPEGLMQVE